MRYAVRSLDLFMVHAAVTTQDTYTMGSPAYSTMKSPFLMSSPAATPQPRPFDVKNWSILGCKWCKHTC